jgi:UDP-hydrolysing UDP-N-acetyl-D-glucosamine 2-epimerase
MKVAVLLSNRCTYTRQQILLEKMHEDKDIDLHIVVTGGLLEKGCEGVLNDIISRFNTYAIDIFNFNYSGNLEDMARYVGRLGGEYCDALIDIEPDCCVVIADRFETLPFANVAAYLNIPLIHIQAFEKSGNIDDKVRDAVSALADVHITSHFYATDRGLKMGYRNIYTAGCPSIDFCKEVEDTKPEEPHLIVMYHPLTTNIVGSVKDTVAIMTQVKTYAEKTGTKIYWFGPNNDPGYKGIKQLLEESGIEYISNIDGREFYKLLKQAQMIVGNSSAGIREASYFGVKAVNIGERQKDRVHGPNVIHCESDGVLRAMWEDKPIFKSNLFGSGNASEKIIKVIKEGKWRR